MAHQERVCAGRVGDSIATATGERIGVGDVVVTRRNDSDNDVANRETWTVTGIEREGMTVLGESGSRVLSPQYVVRHVELGYATTAYGAQGVTVDTAHVLVGDHSGAASTYVGMTRGRHRNVAHLVAETVDDARRQWAAVFARDRADLGPGTAARRAGDDIERYGAQALVGTGLGVGQRTPAMRRGPGMGL